MRAPVGSILLDRNGRATGVRMKRNDVELRAPIVVSTIGAQLTLEGLLPSAPPCEMPALAAAREHLAAAKLTRSRGHLNLFCSFDGSTDELKLPRHNTWCFPQFDHDAQNERLQAQLRRSLTPPRAITRRDGATRHHALLVCALPTRLLAYRPTQALPRLLGLLTYPPIQHSAPCLPSTPLCSCRSALATDDLSRSQACTLEEAVALDEPWIYVGMAFPSAKDPSWGDCDTSGLASISSAVVIAEVPTRWWDAWDGTRVHHRGADYEALKATLQSKLLEV